MTDAEGESKLPATETRNRVIDALTEQFANDALTLEEFEAKLDLAHRAPSEQALQALLPPSPASPLSVPGPAHPIRRVSRAEVKERSLILGFWGGSQRSGAWVPARRNYVVAFQGGAELDLREARFGPGVTDINVFCAMGGVNIIVPPDLQVDFGGIGIMGGFEQEGGARPVTDEGAPVVRIRGVAIWGGAGVEIRHAGETAAEARHRRRLGRKMRRELKAPPTGPTK